MQIAENIAARLKSEYAAGQTYESLAKRHKVSYGYMRGLILGKKPVEKISLDILVRMFPRAVIELDPGSRMRDQVIAENSGVNHGVIGVNNGSASGSSPVEEFRTRAIAALMDLDLPSESIVAVLRTIKHLQ